MHQLGKKFKSRKTHLSGKTEGKQALLRNPSQGKLTVPNKMAYALTLGSVIPLLGNYPNESSPPTHKKPPICTRLFIVVLLVIGKFMLIYIVYLY